MKKIKSLIFTILITLLVSFVYYITYSLGEPKAYDFMVKNVLADKLPFDNTKQVYGTDNVVLIVIDDKSVERYRWPWKRHLYCKILEYLKDYSSAKAVVLDMIFVTKDTDNPDSDRKFLATVKGMDNLVIGFAQDFRKWENPEFGEKYDKIFLNKYGINNIIDLTTVKYLFYQRLVPMPAEFLDATQNAGTVLMPEGFITNIPSWAVDNVYRDHEYIFNYTDNGGYLPSMSLKAFLISNNNPKIVLKNNYIEFPELNYRFPQVKNDFKMFTPLKYYKMHPTGYSHKHYSAIDIMNSFDDIKAGRKPKINPEDFNGKYVLIGANVPAGDGLNDNKHSPINVVHPGVDYQATALDNLVNNDFLKILPIWFNILITLLGMGFVYLGIRYTNLVKSIFITLGIIFIYFAISSLCYYFGIVINVLTPIFMFILTTIISYTHKYVLESKNKEKVQSAMGKFMSADVMKSVIKNIDNLGLGGKKAVVTVLFTDIRGFTSLSETMSAQQVSEFLNEYFTEMEPIVTKYNGIINKFIGDAIMAIFGEPIQDENHAQNAVKCAYEMLNKVNQLNKKWENEDKPQIQIGVGINTGEVFVGNIGSINRMEYTVIGDTVNLASRLESYNKVYKTKILISSSTYMNTKQISDVIKIPDVEIRGKSNKIDIYEVLKVIL